MHYLKKLIIIVAFLSSTLFSLKTASVFQDNMVLQRDKKIKIWGVANPGEKITVSIQNITTSTTTDNNGKWVAILPKLKISFKEKLTIKGEKETIVFKKIMVGDVWLLSGQSNMEFSLASSLNGTKAITATISSNIRLLSIERPDTQGKRNSFTAVWEEATPKNIAYFSAIGYYFADILSKNISVPIGLIDNAWGGSICESWISADDLKNNNEFNYMYENYRTIRSQQEKANTIDIDKAMFEWHTMFTNLWNDHSFEKKGLIKNNYDSSKWKDMILPGYWEHKGLAIDGVVWYKKEITIPEKFKGKDLILNLGPVDDFDRCWVNEKLVGSTWKDTPNFWEANRSYKVPKELTKNGTIKITIRVVDHQYGGGLWGTPEQLFLKLDHGNDKISLAGTWKYFIEKEILEINFPGKMKDFKPHLSPVYLFNTMLHPIIPFSIKGVLWYQGESNSGRAEQYKRLFRYLIERWRVLFEDKKLPFYFVQLASYGVPWDSTGLTWAELRESQTAALTLPNTAMAVTIDIGNKDDIHPKNKYDVGYRLATIAMNNIYGIKTNHSAPTLKKVKFKNNSAILKFNIGNSALLLNSDNTNSGFELADSDLIFYPATAIKLNEKTITLKSDSVKRAIYVRYCWKNYPTATLFNEAGFPVAPFRTDKLPYTTLGIK